MMKRRHSSKGWRRFLLSCVAQAKPSFVGAGSFQVVTAGFGLLL